MSAVSSSIAQLSTEWARSRGFPCVHAFEVDSTLRAVKDLLPLDKEPTDELSLLYVADHQTHGRGRSDHHWYDQGGCLLSTWLYERPTAFQHTSAQLIGLALYESAVLTYPHLPWGLKAPNDLYLQNKKVAGLLVEIVSGGPREQLLVGLGLNVSNHPGEVTHATHLQAFEPRALDQWFMLLDHLQERFAHACSAAQHRYLDPATRHAMTAALNRYVGLAEPYQSVDCEGNLITRTGVQAWSEL